jgi:ATP-dependent helicase/nuclease subunit A
MTVIPFPKADPQIAASDPQASVFVTANAGSGKTSTLVSRVARLLLRGADPAAMLCVTYTKAAAAEMQRRLFQQLGKWSVLDDEPLAREIARLGEDTENLSRARALFARALETPGGLKIQTIHAFCEKLLRRFPLEAGVSPRFTVLEDAAAADLSKQARDAVALHAVAGAGAISDAFSYFAVELDPGRFGDLFSALESNRAAMSHYIDAWSDGSAPSPWQVCGTPEGLEPEGVEAEVLDGIDWGRWREAASVLAAGGTNDQKMAARMAEVTPDGATFDALCAVFCTATGEPRASLASKATAPLIKDWLVEEQARVCAGRERIRAARIARDSVHLLTLAAAYVAIYKDEKAKRAGLDFADLIVKTLDLIAAREDAAWVLYKLDGGIDHILVDEAQDTAPEQWSILRRLSEDFFAGAGSRDAKALVRTLFVVGDEKQSIYSFQGARPERLAEETVFHLDRAREVGSKAVQVPLETSWRSTPQVLGFVDAVFATDEAARALDPTRGHAPHHVASRPEQGAVDLWPLYKDVKPPEREAWDPVDADRSENARKLLARRIAQRIKDAVASGEAVHDKHLGERGAWRGAGYGDFLILVRRRDALFEEIIRALKQAAVPVAGADRLILSKHIAFDDLLGLARLVLFPKDDLTLAALLRSPFCDVDEASLYDLAQSREKGLDLMSALRARAGERAEWASALAFFDMAADEAKKRTPFDFYGRILNRLDETGRSMRARLLTRMGREAEEAIDEFLAQALGAEARGVHALEGLVAALERTEVTVKRELEAARGEVRVMTVHGAKGLEAPVVFLPDTTVKAKPQGSPLFRTADGAFLWAPRKADDCPASADARRLREQKADEESLRLLYVALTRARDRIVLCGRIPATRSADKGSWWTAVEDAFAREEIAEHSREVVDGDLTLTRYGPDPQTAPAGPARDGAGSALPAWARQAVAPERGARWASPSTIADQARAPSPSPLAERGGLGRFRRGELIHKLFQILPDLPQAERAAAAERLLARERGLTDTQLQEMIGSAFGVLDDPRFAAVFAAGSRAEAAVAGTAPGLPEGVAISGRLDRLIVGPDRVLVIDYKTNRPAPDRAEDADFAYLAQMASYVAVLRALYPDRAVEAALVWTDGPKLTPISDALIEHALERMRGAG